MAQSGFILTDEGRTISVTNDSGTTAITAGDLVHVGTVDDVLTGTAASARNAYGIGDIAVFQMASSATGYQTVVGVAIEDIPADGVGAVAMEGVYITAAKANTEAGACLQGVASENKVTVLADATTTVGIDIVQNKIGRALTGGSADGKFIIWKLAL